MVSCLYMYAPTVEDSRAPWTWGQLGSPYATGNDQGAGRPPSRQSGGEWRADQHQSDSQEQFTRGTEPPPTRLSAFAPITVHCTLHTAHTRHAQKSSYISDASYFFDVCLRVAARTVGTGCIGCGRCLQADIPYVHQFLLRMGDRSQHSGMRVN